MYQICGGLLGTLEIAHASYVKANPKSQFQDFYYHVLVIFEIQGISFIIYVHLGSYSHYLKKSELQIQSQNFHEM